MNAAQKAWATRRARLAAAAIVTAAVVSAKTETAVESSPVITTGPTRAIATTPEIEELIRAGSPIAIGVSGGKDSCAVAFAVNAYLDERGHTGPRVLIHSDLGRTEWKASFPTCQRLAERLGLELIVVRREAGDMLDRWQTRWANNVARYINLECVKLILPWSTPSMRFCTSELKTAVICRELTKRFPGQTILSVAGIRREESPARSKTPVVKQQTKLSARGCTGFDWHPIPDWKLTDVFEYLEELSFELHEAYTKYHASRVSCAFCIMSAQADMRAAAGCEDNHDLYRIMVDLEIDSTFSFQDNKWLGDVAPELLSEDQRNRLAASKVKAAQRDEIESEIPKHLLYTKGWPTCIPTFEEARLLSIVRNQVAAIVGLEIKYTTPETIIARYQELMAAKNEKEKHETNH